MKKAGLEELYSVAVFSWKFRIKNAVFLLKPLKTKSYRWFLPKVG
jgi:hypothetical protein